MLRDALKPRIHACTVDVTNSDAQNCRGDECGARVQAGMKQLARFPAACTLTSVSWGLEHWKRSDDDCCYSEPNFHEEMQAGILCQSVRFAWHRALHGFTRSSAAPWSSDLVAGLRPWGQAAPRCLSAGAFQPLYLSSCGSLLCTEARAAASFCFPLRQFWWLPVNPSVCR